MTDCKLEEVLIRSIASRLTDSRHVAVGASSPIPAAAALLAQHWNPSLRVSLLGSEEHSSFTDGGRELFDCAAQGRIDTFFLSGVQIDGAANINLVGTGEYPHLTRRYAGSFGSAYLYHLVPRVMLFCWAHKPCVLVNRVDFISAAGPRDDGVYRTGGPQLLITNRCVFEYDQATYSFRLHSLHPGETTESISENTGFEYVQDRPVLETGKPDSETLDFIRTSLFETMLGVYPQFAERVWSS